MCGGSRCEGALQRRAPLVEALGRGAVDQVEVERREADPRGSTRRRGSTLSGSCWRPSRSRIRGTIDCTPRLILVTPPSAKTASSSSVTSSGLHSTVTSAPSTSGSSREGGDELIRRDQRRRPAADEHGLDGTGLGGERLGDVPPHGGEVVADQVVAIGPRGERAVVASRLQNGTCTYTPSDVCDR